MGAFLGYKAFFAKHSGGAASPSPPAPQPPPLFSFWNGLVANGTWYAFLDVNANQSFQTCVRPRYVPEFGTRGTGLGGGAADRGRGRRRSVPRRVARQRGLCPSCGVDVQVDWANHYANQLFGNPRLLRDMDDAVRRWNPDAHSSSGTLDECGWLDEPDGEPQFHRRKECFYEDFVLVRGRWPRPPTRRRRRALAETMGGRLWAQGFNSSRLQLAQVKGCCAQGPLGRAEPYMFHNDSQYPSPDAGLCAPHLYPCIPPLPGVSQGRGSAAAAAPSLLRRRNAPPRAGAADSPVR